MDITRGNLDEISRPPSNSKNNNGSKILSASLEILTPEPDLQKVDFYYNHTEDNSKEKCENGDKKVKASEEISNGKSSSFELVIQGTNLVEEHSSSSEDDCALNKLSPCSSSSPNKLTKETIKPTDQEDSKKNAVDPQILKAMKKMKRLDQILANKLSQEKAVKKQGREVRRKLWEEYECAGAKNSVIMEEVENTNKFLALTSPLLETPESSAVEETEMVVSVFHTQIHPENYELQTFKEGERCLTEGGSRNSIKQIENIYQKGKHNCKEPPDFVKKNIALAKESANQVVMLEDEKRRLSELLREFEDESYELQVIEGEADSELLPGEGYTPEPMEYQYLTEINAKLKRILSDDDLSAVQSSCSENPKQIYQGSLAYANRKLETIPGEKVLKDTKEERDQQNRLKEIDYQLKNLGEIPDVLPLFSDEQLSALLEECVRTFRRSNNLALTASQGSFLEGTHPCCDIFQNTFPDSRNELLDGFQPGGMLGSEKMVAYEEKDTGSNSTMETSSCDPSEMLIDSCLAEKSENDNEAIQETTAHNSTTEGYFMSLALNRDRPKKPSFLDEPFFVTR